MLGVELEQPFVGADAIRDALGVVEPVDAEQDPLPGGLGARRLAGACGVVLVVDPERESAHLDRALSMLDLARRPIGALAEHALDAVHEVRDVARVVETDQIAREQAAQDLTAPRQHPEQIEGRKRDVQEERHAHVRTQRAQVLGAAGQVVVVDPDEIVVADDFVGPPCEELVHALVDLEIAAIEGRAFEQRVEERPERAVREAVVVALDLGVPERNRLELVGAFRHRKRLVGVDAGARPTDPDASALAHGRIEGCDEPSAGSFDLESILGALHRDRQSVAQYDEALVYRWARHCARITRRSGAGLAFGSKEHDKWGRDRISSLP